MAKRNYYAWVGQNASTGTPNKNTGRMSMYGRDYKFRTKGDRNEFVDEFRSGNPSEFCVACTKPELRGYNLGSSVYDFEESLHQLDFTIKCEDEEWI